MENGDIVVKSFLVAKERFRLYPFRESDRDKNGTHSVSNVPQMGEKRKCCRFFSRLGHITDCVKICFYPGRFSGGRGREAQKPPSAIFPIAD